MKRTKLIALALIALALFALPFWTCSSPGTGPAPANRFRVTCNGRVHECCEYTQTGWITSIRSADGRCADFAGPVKIEELAD